MNIDEIIKNNAKLRVVLEYAIGRLTDSDLETAPDDLRHDWVREASRIVTESREMERQRVIALAGG